MLEGDDLPVYVMRLRQSKERWQELHQRWSWFSEALGVWINGESIWS